MTSFLDAYSGYLHHAWLPHYLPAIACSIVMGVILVRVARRAVLFTIQMLLLFIVLVLGSAVAATVHAADVAVALSQLATLVLGMTLIRQGGLALFRLVVPKLGLRPPRILEELLILLAYAAWVLLRLSAGGLDLGSLVASTAVITAILAFAMQDTLGNILSGLALQLDHSIHIGDWLLVDDVSGQVIQVQWRHTAVRTLYGELVLIPNSQLMKSRVILTGGPSVPQRLRTVKFYCGFNTPPGAIIAEIQRTLAAADMPGIANDPAPVCMITEFCNGVPEYAVRYWLTDPSSPGASDSLIRQHLHAIFSRRGWRMAAPAYDLSIGSGPRPSADAAAQEMSRRMGVLDTLPLFNLLTPEEREQLAAGLEATPYVAGSLITRQHDQGDCLFILVEGQVDVWLENNGRRSSLAILEPVEIMGEMSLLTGEPRSATLTARSDVECYVLGKESFQRTLQNRPELADAFASLLAARSQQRTELHEKMQQVPQAQKQAAILTRMRNLFGLNR